MKSVPGTNKMRTLLSYLTAGNCLGRPLILLSDIVDFKSKEIPVLVVQKTKNVWKIVVLSVTGHRNMNCQCNLVREYCNNGWGDMSTHLLQDFMFLKLGHNDWRIKIQNNLTTLNNGSFTYQSRFIPHHNACPSIVGAPACMSPCNSVSQIKTFRNIPQVLKEFIFKFFIPKGLVYLLFILQKLWNSLQHQHRCRSLCKRSVLLEWGNNFSKNLNVFL